MVAASSYWTVNNSMWLWDPNSATLRSIKGWLCSVDIKNGSTEHVHHSFSLFFLVKENSVHRVYFLSYMLLVTFLLIAPPHAPNSKLLLFSFLFLTLRKVAMKTTVAHSGLCSISGALTSRITVDFEHLWLSQSVSLSELRIFATWSFKKSCPQ